MVQRSDSGMFNIWSDIRTDMAELIRKNFNVDIGLRSQEEIIEWE